MTREEAKKIVDSLILCAANDEHVDGLSTARAALIDALTVPRVPDGWVLVPKVTT